MGIHLHLGFGIRVPCKVLGTCTNTMVVQPFKIQESVSDYSLSFDTLQARILYSEFNTPLGSFLDRKRLHLGTDKVKYLLFMALLFMLTVCNLRCPPY